eukprot:gnl/Chilomastix_cuspidata/4522.p1 GENE.gnl/Chilomastix_cuspidata/4522~~gnl/Chilomastix_cuspidata/4522.p1  ORF type:complete len:540 (+),score=165.81 gnl/Chilomastix_cuspidata/4522:208-1827(+)
MYLSTIHSTEKLLNGLTNAFRKYEFTSHPEQRLQLVDSFFNNSGLSKVFEEIPTIHIAGTKGKGSTTIMSAAMLSQFSGPTAAFTSPHLINVRERISLDGASITEREFAEHYRAVLDTVRSFLAPANQRAFDALLDAACDGDEERVEALKARLSAGEAFIPSFFQTLFFVFARFVGQSRARSAAVEVGLGGRYDTTNALARPSACGITRLDLDHTEVLGSTIEEIARAKAGILKRGVAAVIDGEQRPGALDAVAAVAQEKGIPLLMTSKTARVGDRAQRDGSLPLFGQFQARNFELALALSCVALMEAEARGQIRLSERQRASVCDAFASLGLVSITGNEHLLPDALCDALGRARGPVAPIPAWAAVPVSWPGRASVLHKDIHGTGVRVPLLIDGAHTRDSLAAALDWACGIGAVSRGDGAVLVFYSAPTRPWPEFLRMIDSRLRISAAVFVNPPVHVNVGADGPPERAFAEEMAAKWRQLTNKPAFVSSQMPSEIRRQIQSAHRDTPDAPVVVLGSLHLAGQIYAAFDEPVLPYFQRK